jgi:hypothetical protein
MPPYSTGPEALFVSYYASAELGCHLVLEWPLPVNVLDLHAEFRNLTNGLPLDCGNSLLGALHWFGLGSITAAEKDDMRKLVLRGGPWSPQEKADVLEYCASDVEALGKLLPTMLPRIDVPRALLRGRYMKAAARIEATGIPIDVASLGELRQKWASLKGQLIDEVDKDFAVFDGSVFKSDRFDKCLAAQNIPWPRLPSGSLALNDDTFKMMAQAYPVLQPLRQLRDSLSKLHDFNFPIGTDGRNRCLLSTFRAVTGRNAPGSSKFIFGAPSWLRCLIRPAPGLGLAYIDWEQQEFGIAAALSGDGAMCEAYQSGDPYLAFAVQAKAAPPGATKATHKQVREQFKACALAVQYGMGAESLAARIGQPVARGRELLRLHRETYRRFWAWSDRILDHANLFGRLHTAFGWEIRVRPDVNSRRLRNFPMQANGAEMLRLACCFATEEGVSVCAPVHDALLIEAPLAELEDSVGRVQRAMQKASSLVLDGFLLRSEAKLIRYPDRYVDDRGLTMWAMVQACLANTSVPTGVLPTQVIGVHGGSNACAPLPTRSL